MQQASFPSPLPGKTGWPWDFKPEKISLNFDLPRVTIVTPSYNQAEYLEETIRSVLLQGYPNLEYFVIDGGSTDGSVEIIKKYEPWLAGWVSEKDNGQSNAINKGFSRATGEWLGWLNSDDCFAPYALFNLLRTAHASQAKFVYGSCIQFGMTPRVMPFPKMKLPGPSAFNLEIIRMADIIDQPATLWKREVYEQCGPLTDDLHYVFDWDFFVRCSQQTRGVPCTHPIAAYRLHETNKSTELNLKRDEEMIFVCLKYLPDDLRKKFFLVVPVIKFLKKTSLVRLHGAWLSRQTARIVLAPFRLCWFLRLFGLPMELWVMYGFGNCVDDSFMSFKTAKSPAHTVADSFNCFPEVWEAPH